MGWTDESVAELRRLWDKGLTANEIAKKIGVTKNAIVGKVHRLCLPARPSPIKFKNNENEIAPAEEETVLVEEEKVEIAEEVEEVVAEISKTSESNGSVRTKLTDLDSHTCRWPLGDPRDEDFGFCGKRVRVGQTYCDEHSAIAYVKAVRK